MHRTEQDKQVLKKKPYLSSLMSWAEQDKQA